MRIIKSRRWAECHKYAFPRFAELEIDRSRRNNKPISIAYIDVDNFKQINDSMGHSVGDKLLRLISDLVRRDIRKIDILARLGGDEFAILMPETDETSALSIVERVREKLLESMVRNKWFVTFSVGIATFNTPPNTVNEMIQAADSLMYSAKKNGKNTVKTGVY